MITQIKIATILAVLFMSNLVFAESGKPSFVIKNAGDKSFYFETKDMSSSFVEVIFEDENGKILFTEYAIHTANFERKYNLSELANGAYILKLKTDTTTNILPITITKDNLKIDWEDTDTM
jgi:hypothetical protein